MNAVLLCVVAACWRARDPQPQPRSADPGPPITLIAPGIAPQVVTSPLQPFAPITMRIKVAGTEQATRIPSHPFTMETDLGFARPTAGSDGDATFQIAMGPLYFEPDTTRNVRPTGPTTSSCTAP